MAQNLIDTNIIIRLLVNDQPKQAAQVERLLKTADSFLIPDIVIAEIIWVLLSYYQIAKPSIIEKVRSLLYVDSVLCNTALLEAALHIWEVYPISFIDAYLIAQAQQENLTLYTFDKRLHKIPQAIVKKP